MKMLNVLERQFLIMTLLIIIFAIQNVSFLLYLNMKIIAKLVVLNLPILYHRLYYRSVALTVLLGLLTID